LPVETVEQTNEELILAFLADGGEDFTSGEALSGKLGLSRAAVWKYVESLRHKGYRIEAVPARGYRLVEVPDRVSPLELAPHLSSREIGRVIHHYDSVPSTNELAFRLANQGAAHGEVVIADEQTAGKGRLGRSWASPKGVNLYFSVILRPDLPSYRAPELTLVAAVAAAEAIQSAQVPARIKWPNDLMLGNRKLGGILTELSSELDRIHFAVLGMGINVNSTPAQFSPEVARVAVSISEVLGKRISRAGLAADLWGRLERWLTVHAEQGFAPVRAAWKEFCGMLGQPVLIQTGQKQLSGIAEDIDEAGALILRDSEGKRERVVSGDVAQLGDERPKRE
jgi:BirA family biotin operon repressor/biotin-[acetyl-CoA-carboxylase] ligase